MFLLRTATEVITPQLLNKLPGGVLIFVLQPEPNKKHARVHVLCSTVTPITRHVQLLPLHLICAPL